MATSTFQITFTFDGVDQTAANTKRDNALVDYAEANNLDIYTDATRTAIDPAKVVTAIRSFARANFKAQVIDWRAEKAATAARIATKESQSADIGTP